MEGHRRALWKMINESNHLLASIKIKSNVIFGSFVKFASNTQIFMGTRTDTNTMKGSTGELTARYTPDWTFRGATEVRRGLWVVRGNRPGRMVASKRSVYVSSVSGG